MGCSSSKLDDEEAVRLCKDRNRFIKLAVSQRCRFASTHVAYIHSLKRVSQALRHYIEPPHELFVKKPTPIASIEHNSISSCNSLKVNYFKSGGNPSVLVEETPPTPETLHFSSYSPIHHQFGIDSFFATQSSSPLNSSYSPPNSQWDYFWNPFSSLDYHHTNLLDRTVIDDDIHVLRQVREEEGIPDLEEDETQVQQKEEEEDETQGQEKEEEEEESEEEIPIERLRMNNVASTYTRAHVTLEDVNEDEDGDGEKTDSDNSLNESQSSCSCSPQISRQENIVGNVETKDDTPGFTVYVNHHRPTSMFDVFRNLDVQFTTICNSAKEVSTLLEASTTHYSSTSNEPTAMKMLNPVTLLRSASSRLSSSRFIVSSSLRDEGYASNSDFCDESCMFSGSHQSTLDRLYAWEMKLYKEVRSGEKVRIAYEKKCRQLSNQDVEGADPSAIDKTRVAIRDLHTQIKVSIHSVDAISKRIQTLRDEELQPQLVELVQGLTRMWKVMLECHQSQKQTLDEAKHLLASKFDGNRNLKDYMSAMDPEHLARSASNLETEIRNWRSCFESWITCQRSYVHALAGWLLRCLRSSPDSSTFPSPSRSSCAIPIFGLCGQWSRLLDAARETPVLDGLDFFAAGMGSLLVDNSRQNPNGESRVDKKIVAMGEVEEGVMSVEKMAAVSIRVLCAGMSFAVASLTGFASTCAEEYTQLVNRWENASSRDSSDPITSS